MTRTALVLICAAATGCPARDEPPPVIPAATAPASPDSGAIDWSDAGIIRAQVIRTETVTLDPTPEMKAALAKLDQAKGARDTLERRAAVGQSIVEEAKKAGGLPALCQQRHPPERGYHSGSAAGLPKNFPPPPPDSVVCGSRPDDEHRKVVWVDGLTLLPQEQLIHYYEDALLKRSHTVTRIGRDEGGPGLEFGDMVNGGGLLMVMPRGSFSIRWQPNH